MDRTLVIADGGVASLLACAAASDGGDAIAWIAPADPDAGRMRAAAERQAALYGMRLLSGPPIAPAAGVEGEAIVRRLLEAAYLARSAGASMVVWPQAAGSELDLDKAAAAVDRALLVGRLASLGAETGVEVRVPYVDYTDRQLADLVLDMDLPIWTCWWYDAEGNPGAEAERARWTGLLQQAGWEGELPGPHLGVRTRTSARAEEAGM
jgi:hypothetical protein